MSVKRDRSCVCALCGQPAVWNDPLDEHHVFGGSNRRLSEEFGAVVRLHHFRCHEYGPEAVHVNAAVSRRLKAEHQARIMAEQGWDTEAFIRVFGRNWITEGNTSSVAVHAAPPSPPGEGLRGQLDFILLDEELPLPAWGF